MFIDSFIPEESSEYNSRYAPDLYYGNNKTKDGFAKLAVSQNIIDGRHLWRERRLHTPDLYISDSLQDEISRRGLRIFKHYKLKAV
jgi:hypothetical protein